MVETDRLMRPRQVEKQNCQDLILASLYLPASQQRAVGHDRVDANSCNSPWPRVEGRRGVDGLT